MCYVCMYVVENCKSSTIKNVELFSSDDKCHKKHCISSESHAGHMQVTCRPHLSPSLHSGRESRGQPNVA